jgi:hypothetical protein
LLCQGAVEARNIGGDSGAAVFETFQPIIPGFAQVTSSIPDTIHVFGILSNGSQFDFFYSDIGNVMNELGTLRFP